MENNENIIYNWNFSDEKNRGMMWWTLAIAIVIGIVAWGIFSGQYGLSIVFILAFGVMFFVENNSEKNINVEITHLGIKIGKEFYDFGKIENFSFINNKENAVFLKIILNKKGLKSINLKINNKICEDLKQILPNFIKEEKDSDLSFSEKLINFLKL